VHLRFFLCRAPAGVDAEPREGQAVRWALPSELERYAFPPANAELLEALRCRFGVPNA